MVARVLIIALVAAAGCKKQSELYCDMHPGDRENCGYLDAGIDARPTCMTNEDCVATSPNAPWCEPTARVCVECYDATHCAANAIDKLCDLQTFSCASCVVHSDCASEACLPEGGGCGDELNVAYVDPTAGVDNKFCTLLLKCKTVKAALATGKLFIKLQGTIDEAIVVDARAVTFLGAPGTVIKRSMNGVIVVVTKGSDAAFYDVRIEGAGEKGIFIDMKSTLRLTRVEITGCNAHDRRAIEVKDARFLMTRSSIHENLGGGIIVDATSVYQITNSFIVRNGAADSQVGGAVLASTGSAIHKFELNTVADNVARDGVAGGVQCAASIAAPNNLVVRNTTGTTTDAMTQARGTCIFTQSKLDPDATSYLFINADAPAYDYHLGATSAAIDQGVMSSETIDFDGEPRPNNMRFDFGADEFPQ
jgi:hypothetical protein